MSGLERVGPITLRRLLELGRPDEVWRMIVEGRLPPRVVASLPGPSAAQVAAWPAWARTHRLDPAALWERCERFEVGAVSLGAPGYPGALMEDPEPPVVLFHRGDPDVLSAPRVAIVGTRRATGYGRRIAHDLGRELAAAGVCVVSGLAMGVDAAAHRGALAAIGAGGAPPAAVVGGGLDAPGPPRNADLARTLVEHGVVLAEVPPTVPATPWRFPVRNRVLAGLAQAVVVVESAVRGGSMITVAQAQLRDVPVLAVPGPVDSEVSEGTNRLLEEGAGVCTGVQDVLAALGADRPSAGASTDLPRDPRPRPSGDAARLLDELGWRPCTPDQLAARLGLGFAELAAAIGVLERDGWVLQRGGWVERVARPPVRHLADPPP
jgi:DNA processing protein